MLLESPVSTILAFVRFIRRLIVHEHGKRNLSLFCCGVGGDAISFIMRMEGLSFLKRSFRPAGSVSSPGPLHTAAS
jgi:hypothetical protein